MGSSPDTQSRQPYTGNESDEEKDVGKKDVGKEKDVDKEKDVGKKDVGKEKDVDKEKDVGKKKKDVGKEAKDGEVEKMGARGPWSARRYNKARKINELAKNDYYGILDLEKSCTTDDIKKQYKRLALFTHTDKSNWPDSKEAFQRISTAFDVLSNPEKRSSYDGKKRGKYRAPSVDAKKRWGEEFGPNAFDDGNSEPENDDDDSDDEDKMHVDPRPNEANKKIFEEATPFIQGLLMNPPTTQDAKDKNIKIFMAFNERIRAQNIQDGLKDGDQASFYIKYSIFENNGLLAKEWVEKIRINQEDQEATAKLKNLDDGLKAVIKENEYPDGWCYQGVWDRDYGSHPESHPGRNQGGRGSGQTKGGNGRASSERGEALAKFEPGYTLTGEKIIAMIPRVGNYRPMDERGIPGPRQQYVTGYQFIVKDEEENVIELVSGDSIGQKATSGYLSLPEDQKRDARYSDKRYTRDDAGRFDTLVDFASMPFQQRSTTSDRHPVGYGLVNFKDGTEDVLNRTALRKMLGRTDADFEIQECEKRNGKLPAWTIEPGGWREPKPMTIEPPTQRRLRMYHRSINNSESDRGMFVQEKLRGGRGNTTRGRRDVSQTSSHAIGRGRRSVSRVSSNAEEIAGLTNTVKGLETNMESLQVMMRQLLKRK